MSMILKSTFGLLRTQLAGGRRSESYVMHFIYENKDVTAKSTEEKHYGTYNSNNEHHCQFPAYKVPALR